MQRTVSVYGSSSAVRGVHLKIGEKFKPPTKVTLPLGWKTRDPSRILSLAYDFSLEEEVIERAKAERQAKEQEENAKKAKELLASQQPNPVIANMGGDILMPTTVISPSASTAKDNEREFNYKDFEGTGDSPFELVELQSINNMDALKSVLQPQLQCNASGLVLASDDVPEEQVTDTNTTNRQTSTGDHQAITPPISTFNTAGPTQPLVVNPSVPSHITPQFSQNGYPVPGQAQLGLNERQDQYLYRPQNSRPCSVDNQMPVGNMDVTSSPQQDGATSFYNTKVDSSIPMPGAKKVLPSPPMKPLPRRQSAGNESLDGNMDVVGSPQQDGATSFNNTKVDSSVPMPGAKKVFPSPPMKPLPRRPQSGGNESLDGNMDVAGSPQQDGATSFNNTKVDSSVPMPGAKKVFPSPPMKPLPRRPSAGNESLDGSLPTVINRNKQNRPTPKPRSKLPPIKSQPGSSDTPPPLPPKKLKVKKQGYENIPIQQKPVLADDNHLKHYPSLPPISPPPTLDNPASNSLPPSMSSDEVQFVSNLSSMGFPAARTARAVKNFGCEERKVVEYLIAVNAMCDKGFYEEDVEMVLKETSSNQEKAETFLNLLTQFKELGFPEEKIFDALKKSECDSNKTLDILTCAG